MRQVVAVAALVWAVTPVAAQERGSAWTMPRMVDGSPDLQGIWTTQTFTPLQRP